MKTICYLLIIFFLAGYQSNAQKFQIRDVATELDTPWEILWGPDDHIWMTERYGRISRVDPETGEIDPLVTIPGVFEEGERGLLGMVLHPNFADTAHVYVVYTYRGGVTGTLERCVRGTYDGESIGEMVIILDSLRGYWNHDGSRLWITEDRKLFMTVGDAGAFPYYAQDLSNYNGSTLRMNLDGSAPEDNPFPDNLLWSWGHRNAQGLVMANGIMYSSEHGPNTDDELNIIHKGRNYGWPQVKGYCDNQNELAFCEDSNVVEPILSLFPKYTVAACGIDYYGHDRISKWKNSILLVALKNQTLFQIKLDESGQEVVEINEYFIGQFGRLRDLCISPDGKVYIATSNRDQTGQARPGDDKIIEIDVEVEGTAEDYPDEQLNVWPNPSTDEVSIGLPTINSSSAFLKIYDQFGNIVKGTAISPGLRIFRWNRFSESGYKCPSGTYMAIFSFNNKILKTRIVLF